MAPPGRSSRKTPLGLTDRTASESVKQQCSTQHFAQENGAHDDHERRLQDTPTVTGCGGGREGLGSLPLGDTGVTALTNPVRASSVGLVCRQAGNRSQVQVVPEIFCHVAPATQTDQEAIDSGAVFVVHRIERGSVPVAQSLHQRQFGFPVHMSINARGSTA